MFKAHNTFIDSTGFQYTFNKSTINGYCITICSLSVFLPEEPIFVVAIEITLISFFFLEIRESRAFLFWCANIQRA